MHDSLRGGVGKVVFHKLIEKFEVFDERKNELENLSFLKLFHFLNTFASLLFLGFFFNVWTTTFLSLNKNLENL